MSRTASRRQNKRLQRIQTLKQSNGEVLRARVGQLLAMWKRELEFRAQYFFDRAGKPVPAAWDLFKRRRHEAAELGIEEEFKELCRQALAREIGTGSKKIGASKIFVQ